MEKYLYNPLPTVLIKVVAFQSCLSLKKMKKNEHSKVLFQASVCHFFFCGNQSFTMAISGV